MNAMDDTALEHQEARPEGRVADGATDAEANTAADVAAGAIPPATNEACDAALQARIASILQKQKANNSNIIAYLRANRNYRNPCFMEQCVETTGIYKYGTCFDPNVFDPRGMPEEDFLPAIKEKLEQQVRHLQCSSCQYLVSTILLLAVRSACK
jgi:HCNGP-like protein